MKQKVYFQKIIWGSASFLVCLALYLSLAFLMLGEPKTEADISVDSVPYKTAEEFSLLLACDELDQFCGITVYPDEKRITAALFDSRTDAENYRNDYSRRIEYSKMTEIDVIGRIGGIVIDTKIGYNDNLESSSAQRLFGSRVLEYARDREMRADIAQKLLTALLSASLNEDDFNFIFSSCSTDVSYVDFCEYFPLLHSLCDNITVTIG